MTRRALAVAALLGLSGAALLAQGRQQAPPPPPQRPSGPQASLAQLPPDDLSVFTFGIVAPRATSAGPSRALAPPTRMLVQPQSVMADLGLDRYDAGVRLDGDAAVGEISAGYASQMSASGWRVETKSADGAAMSVTRLGGASRSGTAIVASLLIVRLTPSIVDVALHALRTVTATSSSSGGTYGSYAGAAGGTYGGYATGASGAGATGTTDPTMRGSAAGIPPALITVLRMGRLTASSAEPWEVGTSVPAEFPRELLPPGAEVGVTARSPRMTTVVATLMEYSPGMMTGFLTRLSSSGWIVGSRAGGGASGATDTIDLCRATESATLQFIARDAGSRFLRASALRSVGPRVGPMPCGASPNTFAAWNDVSLPMLQPPADAASVHSESASGLDSWNLTTRFDTHQPMPALTQQFLDQMGLAGWKLEGRADDGIALSSARFGMPAPSGERLIAFVTTTLLPGTIPAAEVWLRVIRFRP